jgi:hypothetical protein
VADYRRTISHYHVLEGWWRACIAQPRFSHLQLLCEKISGKEDSIKSVPENCMFGLFGDSAKLLACATQT